jgi:hypothetical protein
MALDWTATDTYYFVDQENKIMVVQNWPWLPNGDNGKQDSIGTNFICYVTYNDERFLEGIKNCWVKKESNSWFRKHILKKPYYYQGYRYPDHNTWMNNISRDHTFYTIAAYKYSGMSNKDLKEFVTHIPYKISKATPGSRTCRFTVNMWLWAHAIYGSKFYEWLYYRIETPFMRFTSWWNKILYNKITNWGEELHQDDFYIINEKYKSKRDLFLNELKFPIYALHQTAWAVNLLPDSKQKKKLQKIILDLAPKHNYVIKMLLGDKTSFKKEDVFNYKPMCGSRWTGILIPILNNRWLEIIGVPESIFPDPVLIRANTEDIDYVKKLYEIT